MKFQLLSLKLSFDFLFIMIAEACLPVFQIIRIPQCFSSWRVVQINSFPKIFITPCTIPHLITYKSSDLFWTWVIGSNLHFVILCWIVSTGGTDCRLQKTREHEICRICSCMQEKNFNRTTKNSYQRVNTGYFESCHFQFLFKDFIMPGIKRFRPF